MHAKDTEKGFVSLRRLLVMQPLSHATTAM